MDRIYAKVGLSPHMGNIEHLSIYINGERLDKYLCDNVDKEYLGLIPAWLDYYGKNHTSNQEEKKYVWKQTRLCSDLKVLPILLCPDDFDFFCTVLIAEVIDEGDTVRWNRIGIDCTEYCPTDNEDMPKYIGKKEVWFDNIRPFIFKKTEYLSCIKMFNPDFENILN